MQKLFPNLNSGKQINQECMVTNKPRMHMVTKPMEIATPYFTWQILTSENHRNFIIHCAKQDASLVSEVLIYTVRDPIITELELDHHRL